jgi:PPOX class probable F420-dependent enzyme
VTGGWFAAGAGASRNRAVGWGWYVPTGHPVWCRDPVPCGKALTVAASLSDGLKKYLDESRPFVTVATISPDGRPHLTVVWVIRDGDDLLFSTTVDRLQGRNLRRDPRITVMINPPEDPYVYAEIRGTATVTPDSDKEVLNKLSLKYTGKDYAAFNPSSQGDGERVVVRVTPAKVVGRL